MPTLIVETVCCKGWLEDNYLTLYITILKVLPMGMSVIVSDLDPLL